MFPAIFLIYFLNSFSFILFQFESTARIRCQVFHLRIHFLSRRLPAVSLINFPDQTHGFDVHLF
jgi:hypothetical protein